MKSKSKFKILSGFISALLFFSTAVGGVVLPTVSVHAAPKEIARGAKIDQLFPSDGSERNLNEGERGQFKDTFYMKTYGAVPYFVNEDPTFKKPVAMESSAQAYVEQNVPIADRDIGVLAFGNIKDAESTIKKQSAYIPIDATNYKDLTFSIKFRQKATGSDPDPAKFPDLNNTAKVSCIIEYSVDGGKTYQEIRKINNKGGNTASTTNKTLPTYIAFYTPESDSYKDYALNKLNTKGTRLPLEDDDTVYLAGADFKSDVRVRFRTCIYENSTEDSGNPDVSVARAYEAEKNAINALNYIAFDNLTISGTYTPAHPVDPTGVQVSSETLSLIQNKTSQLSATVLPANANNKEIQWRSSNENIATVSSDGLITALSTGKVDIYAKNPQSGFEGKCVVTVNAEIPSTRLMTSFAFTEPRSVGIIDMVNSVINVRVPVGTDKTKLVANFYLPNVSPEGTITVNGVTQTSGVTKNDFTAPVKYVVKNISNDTTEYTVNVVDRNEADSANDTYIVSTPDEILALNKILKPGDTVVMKNGDWNDSDILLAADGLAEKPITIRAETKDGVVLKGASRITLSGSYLIVDGVSFLGESEKKLDGAVVFNMFSYNCRMTNCVIDKFNPTKAGEPKHHWVWNYGTYNRIDHNVFRHKEKEGEMLRLYKGIEHHALIDHNYFGERIVNPNFTNNLECIQIGMYMGSGSAWETVPSYTVVEHNYFYQWDGEIEIISVKAHNAILRYNTIEDCKGTFCLRISDNSEIYGNYFIQNGHAESGGIRAYGSGHKIYNNYVEGTIYQGSQRAGVVLQAGSELGNSSTDVKVSENTIVANNTIVNCGLGLSFGAEPSALKPVAPRNDNVVNNVIIGSDDKKTIMNTKSPTNSVIKNNYVQPKSGNKLSGSSSTEEALPDTFEFIKMDLKHQKVNDSVYATVLSTVYAPVYMPMFESPVIGAGNNLTGVDLSFIKEDITGKSISSVADVGAFQSQATGVATNRRMTRDDVGNYIFTDISITKPAKNTYKVNETLDISGIEVTGTYTDNFTKETVAKKEYISASNITGFDSSKETSNQQLTITVNGLTTSYVIAIIPEAPKNISVVSVSLDKKTVSMNVGDTPISLVATILPADATNKNKTWSSSDQAVASVQNGVVTAVATGSTTITVTTADGVKTDTCVVTVSEVPKNISVTSVSLDKKTVSMNVGDTPISLVATILPADATNKNKTWSSSNQAVATVQNGVVTAVGTGSTTITVTTADGGKADTCVVTVMAQQNNHGGSSTSGDRKDNSSSAKATTPSTTNTTPSTQTPKEVVVTTTPQITKTTEGGKTITNLVVDKSEVMSLANNGAERIIIEGSKVGNADITNATLPADVVKELSDKNVKVEVNTQLGNYVLEGSKINLGTISSLLGESSLANVRVDIRVAVPDTQMAQVAQQAMKQNDVTLVGSPVDFTVQFSSSNGKSIELKNFISFVERMLPLPSGTEPNSVTTAVVVEPNGVLRPIPTKVVEVNGEYFAKVNSVTNSTYALISNTKIFSDMNSHWGKGFANDLGSRLIIKGNAKGNFDPNKAATRAEFVSMVARAYGLDSDNKGTFKDVTRDKWYYKDVNAAFSYGLITGDEKGNFNPNKTISRQEAMVIISRSMKLAALDINIDSQDVKDLLSKFSDNEKVSSWAQKDIATCVKFDLIKGDNKGNINAQSNITRAEIANIIFNLLKTSGLS